MRKWVDIEGTKFNWKEHRGRHCVYQMLFEPPTYPEERRYFGYKKINKAFPTYPGSSAEIKNELIPTYGDDYERMVLHVYDTEEEARTVERQLLVATKAKDDPLYLNLHDNKYRTAMGDLKHGKSRAEPCAIRMAHTELEIRFRSGQEMEWSLNQKPGTASRWTLGKSDEFRNLGITACWRPHARPEINPDEFEQWLPITGDWIHIVFMDWRKPVTVPGPDYFCAKFGIGPRMLSNWTNGRHTAQMHRKFKIESIKYVPDPRPKNPKSGLFAQTA